VESKKRHNPFKMRYWEILASEIIADRLRASGFSWACSSQIDATTGRVLYTVDAYRDDGRRFVARADEKLTAFLELEAGSAPQGLPRFDNRSSACHTEEAMTQAQENQDTRAAWDKIAPGYAKTRRAYTYTWVGNEGLLRAGLRPGMRFLDVAAGSGALSLPAARLGAQVLATDLSPVMLELLKKRARDEGLIIETRVMDGHALELDDNSFDMAGSQFGVMLFPDASKGISKMARVVKPGGRVLMNVLGNIRKVEFFAFFVRGIQSVRPDFTGPRWIRRRFPSSCKIRRDCATSLPRSG
jgi:SAM-dependent methyltransferase